MPIKDILKRRAVWRKWYAKNSTRLNAKKAPGKVARRKAKVKRFQEYKSTLKCHHCPMSNPVCLQFHHKGGKVANLSDVSGLWSWERLMREVAKCIVLCANCHAIETRGVAQRKSARLGAEKS